MRALGIGRGHGPVVQIPDQPLGSALGDGFAFGHAWAPGWRKHHPAEPPVNVIIAQPGTSTLQGTAGPDRFVIGPDGGVDFISNFQPGVDKLDLRRIPGLDGPEDVFFPTPSPVQQPGGTPTYSFLLWADFDATTGTWGNQITITSPQPFSGDDIIW